MSLWAEIIRELNMAFHLKLVLVRHYQLPLNTRKFHTEIHGDVGGMMEDFI